ncbi:manganese efflux pump MntP family protein [Paenibacillus beijingensis]|uniref:Putative manganese efflux pump MntP n=1 Tax=Paenibacillus beijingensis TaxID=1126833 RepID=A0A0D5NGQ1_9BACL|nr:manganese efflux pump [Paenibacillus beijingensis]AJY74579.1 membrane protein [Paenibacillus beijingensis]
MVEASLYAGQILTLLIMALALGMDAFSLGIGIGMKGIRLLDMLKLSLVIGIFHVMMPLAGMFAGHYVSFLLGHIATAVAGGLLLVLGGHMIYSAVRGEEVRSIDHGSVSGLLLFALSVSVDSFSVGISLGMFAVDQVLTVLLFGAAGTVMSVLGLMLGKGVGRTLGGYGEAVGGVILFTFGMLFIL